MRLRHTGKRFNFDHFFNLNISANNDQFTHLQRRSNRIV